MKTKIITGIALALCLASMLSIMPASAVVTKSAAVFYGKVTWAYGEDAWGSLYARAWGDQVVAFAWFYVPEEKVFCQMKLVEVDEAWFGEDAMEIEGWWAFYENREFVDYYYFGIYKGFDEEFWILWEWQEWIAYGETIRYKTWDL